MNPRDEFLCDAEVCELLKISQSTLSRILNGFIRYSRKSTVGTKIDLVKAEPYVIGGYRRWNVTKLANALGMTREQLQEAVNG